MRKIIRILRRTGVAISLLLCLAVFVLWVRSYWKSDCWGRFGYFIPIRQYRQEFMESKQGLVGVVMWRSAINHGWLVRELELSSAKGNFSYQWHEVKLGGEWWPAREHWWEWIIYLRVKKNDPIGPVPGATSGAFVMLPYWVLVVLFSILPAIWAGGRWRKRSRLRGGRCARCGYDLRASPERCPECGAVTTK